jgi:hypothetical protein
MTAREFNRFLVDGRLFAIWGQNYGTTKLQRLKPNRKKKSLKENHLEKFVRKKVEREMVHVWQKRSPFCDAPPRRMQSFTK